MFFLCCRGGMAIFLMNIWLKKERKREKERNSIKQRVISPSLLQCWKVCGKDVLFILSTSLGELELVPPSVMLNVQEFSLSKKKHFLLNAVCISLFQCHLRSFLLWPIIIELRCFLWKMSIFVECGLLRSSSADQFGVVCVQDNHATYAALWK